MAERDCLILLHAIFRHGNRTPIKEHSYPKNVRSDEDFHPYGPGQLTQEGKRNMYELGEILRGKYDRFLGDTYIPRKVDAQATNLDRTQMSLQLVLAAMFPPKKDQTIKDDLTWQPIPYKCVPPEQDRMFAMPSQGDFVRVYMENYRKTLMAKYASTLDYFGEHTGIENPTSRNVWVTMGTIMTETEWGFETPPWVAPIYDTLVEIAIFEYEMQTATAELRRLVIGELFKKILKDTRAKINNESNCDIHLYSGHNHNVAHVLIILGLMYPHFPKYAACVVLEVYRLEDGYNLKVIYKEGIEFEFKAMTFPDGTDTLSLRQFEETVGRLTR